MKGIDFNDFLDANLGKVGTPERDKFDNDVRCAVESYKMGEAIKQARITRNLTQNELAERMGVRRERISRIEKGCNLTFSTISRAMRALGVNASIEMQGIGSVELC